MQDRSKLTKNNIEVSFLSEIMKVASDTMTELKGSSDKSFFIAIPDFQKFDVKFPVVIASTQTKVEQAVGQGKIGHGGKRQVIHTYELTIGIVARTSREIGMIEEAITSRFSGRHWLDVYQYDERGTQGDLAGCCRIKILDVDYSPTESLAGNKVSMLAYQLTAYKNID